MKTPQKTTYYLITEKIGDVIYADTPLTTRIRGLYTTQAKALSELFRIANQHAEDGTVFLDEHNNSLKTPISELIHSQTNNGETTILGYNQDRKKVHEFQIKTITLDISSLITI